MVLFLRRLQVTLIIGLLLFIFILRIIDSRETAFVDVTCHQVFICMTRCKNWVIGWKARDHLMIFGGLRLRGSYMHVLAWALLLTWTIQRSSVVNVGLSNWLLFEVFHNRDKIVIHCRSVVILTCPPEELLFGGGANLLPMGWRGSDSVSFVTLSLLTKH